MGASGAGKTTLLNILSGRMKSKGRISIEADIRLDNIRIDPKNAAVRRTIAFVAQDDALPTTSTPRELLSFSAKLRLPTSYSDEDITALTNGMLDQLGLTSCADTVVGGPLRKGISGGERKRTSVGIELVVRPLMIFLDEPTSGLDSFSAIQVCQVLQTVAESGASVLFTIHQPSSELFASFGNLIFMKSGRVMYNGAVADVVSFFEERGYPCPDTFNPADWIVVRLPVQHDTTSPKPKTLVCFTQNVAQEDTVEALEKHGFFPTDDRCCVSPNTDEPVVLFNGERWNQEKLEKSSFFQQAFMLISREVNCIRRDPSVLVPQLLQTAFLAAALGIIFFQVGKASPSDEAILQSRFGVLTLLGSMTLIGTGQASLLAWPEERPVFLREYMTNHYGVPAYVVAQLVVRRIGVYAGDKIPELHFRSCCISLLPL